MPLHTIANQKNADFFLERARPGMLGLTASAGRVMPDIIRWVSGMKGAGANGTPSLWSHTFVVTEREDGPDGTRIHIVESTEIPRGHRTDHGKDAQGDPDWNGPQRSLLVARRADGSIVGQPYREDLRRYISDVYTPNVALVDFHLSAAQVAHLQDAARRSLVPEARYPVQELVGFLLQTIAGDIEDRNILDGHDMFCSAYCRRILAPHVPPIRDLPVHESTTSGEHLYTAVREPYDVFQIVRSPQPRDVGAWPRALRSVEKALTHPRVT